MSVLTGRPQIDPNGSPSPYVPPPVVPVILSGRPQIIAPVEPPPVEPPVEPPPPPPPPIEPPIEPPPPADPPPVEPVAFARVGRGRLIKDGAEIGQFDHAEDAYAVALRSGSGTYQWQPPAVLIRVP